MGRLHLQHQVTQRPAAVRERRAFKRRLRPATGLDYRRLVHRHRHRHRPAARCPAGRSAKRRMGCLVVIVACAMSAVGVGASPLLQVHARGMACATWHGGPGPPPGMGVDCLFHSPPGSSVYGSPPWLGSVDASSGTCSDIDGVTSTYSNFTMTRGGFVSAEKHSHFINFANLGPGGWYAVKVVTPESATIPGAVHVLGKVTDADWPPAWMEHTGLQESSGIVGW